MTMGEFLKNVGDKIRGGLVWFFLDNPYGFVVIIVTVVFGVCGAAGHMLDADEQHVIHDRYVLKMQICEVHNGWYVPSQAINGSLMIPCRRLTDHSLFYVQDTGREMIPSLEYTQPQHE